MPVPSPRRLIASASVLLLVLALAGYHAWCWRLLQAFAAGRNTRSARWFRWFNEIPSLLLVAIVLLAVVRPY